jgi:hypothetical protein
MAEMLAGSGRACRCRSRRRASRAARSALARVPGAGALRRTPLAGWSTSTPAIALFRALERLDKVVIAAIGGPTIGAACGLALACDLRYISSDAAQSARSSWRRIRARRGRNQRHSRARAGRRLEPILEARAPTPEKARPRARAPGRSARAAPRRALATAHRLARRAPSPVAAAKRALYDGRGRSLDSALAVERRWFMARSRVRPRGRPLRLYVDDLHRDGRSPLGERADVRRVARQHRRRPVELDRRDGAGASEVACAT